MEGRNAWCNKLKTLPNVSCAHKLPPASVHHTIPNRRDCNITTVSNSRLADAVVNRPIHQCGAEGHPTLRLRYRLLLFYLPGRRHIGGLIVEGGIRRKGELFVSVPNLPDNVAPTVAPAHAGFLAGNGPNAVT